MRNNIILTVTRFDHVVFYREQNSMIPPIDISQTAMCTSTKAKEVMTHGLYLHLLQNIEAQESSAMPVAGIISIKESNALMCVCICHLSLLGYFISFLILPPIATGEGPTSCCCAVLVSSPSPYSGLHHNPGLNASLHGLSKPQLCIVQPLLEFAC